MKRNNNLFVLITLSFALILTTAACQGAELAVDPAEVEAESTAIAAESTAAASGINDVFSSVYPPQDPNAATLTDLPGAITTESGLQFLEIEPGEGSHPKDGDIVLMNLVAAFFTVMQMGALAWPVATNRFNPLVIPLSSVQ